MKKVIGLVLSISAMTLMGGCTTGMLSAPSSVNAQQNIYSFKIDTSMYASPTKINNRANLEFTKFMNAHGYKSYKVLNRHYELMPVSGFKYTVQFYK